jgi:ABC transport system ATP-binding/permease protein
MLKLIIEDDEGKTTVVPLIRDEITIGRKEGNTIRLTERNISRRHARLSRRNGQVFLEDLESYNGIKVNGQRIAGQVSVKEGDRIQIGDYALALKLDQPAQTAAPADPFDEMKTIPVEKAEAQAMNAHLVASGAAPAPAAATPAVAEPAAAAPRAQKDLIAEAAAAKSKESPARLVVVSSNFAGLECQLDKAAQVVGRTEDNDIVINHRSISRNHAKVIRQGNSYRVEDLGSANGIYVNGEKYDRIELHSGDMVDLGHVRLRFVAPGEIFAFDPSMVEDVGPTPKRSGTTLYVILGVLLVAGAVAGILAATGTFSGKKSKAAKDESGNSTAVADAGSGSVPGDSKVYEPVKQALAAKDWKAAVKTADDLLIKNAQDAEAKRLKDKAVDEQKNEALKSGFFQALKDGDRAKAVFEGSQISTDSVYFSEVSQRLEQEKQQLKSDLVNQAQQLAKSGKCRELGDLSKKLQAVDPSETSVSALLRSCKPAGDTEIADARVPPPEDMRDRPPSRDTVMDPPMARDRPPTMDPVEAMADGPSTDKLYEQARDAWQAGNCSKAISLADEANRKQFSPRNVSIIGVCSCTVGNTKRAKWAYKVLKGGQRNILVQLCKSKGINLP